MFDWLQWRARRLPPERADTYFNVTLSLSFASPLTNGLIVSTFPASEALMMAQVSWTIAWPNRGLFFAPFFNGLGQKKKEIWPIVEFCRTLYADSKGEDVARDGHC
jgi:hypothetical protein